MERTKHRYQTKGPTVIAKQKLNNMKRLWKGQSIDTKLRVLQSCIFPVPIYGCEAWTPLQADIIKRLVAFEMTCYRKLLHISWAQKLTNEEVKSSLQPSFQIFQETGAFIILPHKKTQLIRKYNIRR